VLDFVRAAKKTNRLLSLIRPGHRQSIRVAEKLGANFERTIDFEGGPIGVYVHRLG
jgi:hypothetical protein